MKIGAILWNEWIERNNRLFRNRTTNPITCYASIEDDYDWWASTVEGVDVGQDSRLARKEDWN